MLTYLRFILPNEYGEKQLVSQISDHYSIKKERPVLKSFSFYDTFDWRLFNKSLVLCESGSQFFLRRLFEDTIQNRINITSQPVFIWDFPDSKLKEQLAPIIKMRALLKLVEIQSRSAPYRILNLDKKTVVRLVYEKIRPFGTPDTSVLATYLWLKPLKGYPKHSQRLTERCEESGFLPAKKEDIYFKALKVVKKKPGSYSSKIKIHLDPDMRSGEATKIILHSLLRVMKINEAHLKKDVDTEFLHDFRVAIRRTRSALGQIKLVLPQETTKRFKKDFAFVGKLSNQLRDLDVYLLKEDTYKKMLPAVLHDDIAPLFDFLREKRSKMLKKVISGLKSKKYVQIFHDWEVFLNNISPESSSAPNADLPIINIARKRISKLNLKIVKDGNRILENTQDEMLHALRIECKKLRYLMEFFSNLFPREKIKILIAQLKKLQDNLGDFNDLCVQEEYLLNIAKEWPTIYQKSKKILVAIGSLIGSLDKEKKIVKDAFAKTFTEYASKKNKGLFLELFASK